VIPHFGRSLFQFPLGLTLPSPFPSHTTETLCESAARLLFMNVKWAKNVPAFTSLSFSDQVRVCLYTLGMPTQTMYEPHQHITRTILCAADTNYFKLQFKTYGTRTFIIASTKCIIGLFPEPVQQALHFLN
jgi:hypothetical protein